MADEPGAKASAAPPPEAPQPEPAGSRPPGEAPKPGDTTPRGSDDLPDPSAEEIQRRTDPLRDLYSTTFTGSVYAGTIQFGPASSRRNWSVRRIDDAEVVVALQHFVEPPGFVEAASVLISTRLVVLGGPPRSGRRCAAIALLDQGHCAEADPRQAIAELAPSISMPELLDLVFEKGGRYLLRGFPTDKEDDQLRFDVQQLAVRLRDAGAYLVITSDFRAGVAFDVNTVRWTAVDCRDILAAHQLSTGSPCSPEESVGLTDVVQHLRPNQMCGFLSALEESGVAAAIEEFRVHAHGNLLSWLNDRPPLSELVRVVTAAFFPGVPQDAHERHAADLLDAIDRFCQPDPAPRPYVDELRPSRRTRPRCLDVDGHPGLGSGRGVRLSHGTDPGTAFTELDSRYGQELWMPLAGWLDERPGLVSFVEETALVSAISELRRVDRPWTQRVLDGWAGTVASGRVAARAVSALCVDEQGTTDALHTAVRWATGGRSEKITAAFVFGQRLSALVPVEALSRLWDLALGGDRLVARYASVQLAATVRALATDPQRLRFALGMLDHHVKHLVTERADENVIDRGLTATATILAVTLPQRMSLTTHVLREVPDQIGRLGGLWAQVLRSWEHRGDALERLVEVADAVRSDTERDRFARLRSAMQEHLDPLQWRWVVRDLGTSWKPVVPAEGAVL